CVLVAYHRYYSNLTLRSSQRGARVSTLFPYTTLFRSPRLRLEASRLKSRAAVMPIAAAIAVVPSSIRMIFIPDFRNISCISILRSEEHTSELQSRFDLVCRLLLVKKNNNKQETLILNL